MIMEISKLSWARLMTLNQWPWSCSMFLVFIFHAVPRHSGGLRACRRQPDLHRRWANSCLTRTASSSTSISSSTERVSTTSKLAALNGGRFFGSTIKNPVLVALPMFIFMGLMLDQSGVAQRMMRSMQVLFGALRGGLALAVMLIGIILAASTGVIGASVVAAGRHGHPDDDGAELFQAHRHRHDCRIGHPGHPHSAVDHAGDHVGPAGDLARRSVHGSVCSRA